jgi:hypothetical protein
MASSIGEVSGPRAPAVLRMITSSNLVGCITGTSLGLVPFTRPALGARHERRRNRAKQDGTLRQLVAR